LHTNVHQLRVLLVENSFITVIDPESVSRLELEVLLEEREMLFVSSAHDDNINFFSSSILKGAHFAFNFSEERLGFKTFRPVESHRSSSVRAGDVLASIFVALRSNIFSRVRSSNDHNALVGEFTSISEVVRVKYSSLELFNAREIRHVRNMEVTSASHHIVEFLSSFFTVSDRTFSSVFSDSDREVICLRVEHYGVNNSVEVNPVLDVRFLNASIDVIL